MGLMFLYLTPCFYVDVTESWVSAGRLQRMATIIAGIWIELILCGLATIVWTNTQPGEWIHDFCYKLILLTGLGRGSRSISIPSSSWMGTTFSRNGCASLISKSVPPGSSSAGCSAISFAFPSMFPWFPGGACRFSSSMPSPPALIVTCCCCCSSASATTSSSTGSPSLRWSRRRCWHLSSSAPGCAGSRPSLWTSTAPRLGDGAFRLTPLRAVLAIALLALLFVPILRDRENAYFVIEPQRDPPGACRHSGKGFGRVCERGRSGAAAGR